jgi:hypothetical protein
MNLASRAAAALTSGIKSTFVQATIATPAALERKLRDTKARLAQLEHQHSAACLQWAESGDASERDHLAGLIAAVRADLSSLQLALTEAHQRIAAEERAKAASLHASRAHSMTMHFRSAEKHAAALAEALTKAADARRGLLESSAKARKAAPTPLPMGSLTEAALLDRLICNEAYRVSHKIKLGHLPGSVAPTISTKENPEAIPALFDQLKQAHDFAIGVVRGEVSAPQTPTGIAAAAADASAAKREPITEPPEVDTNALGPFVAPDLSPQKLSLTD